MSKYIIAFTIILFTFKSYSNPIESIFVAPDVFVTSKIKPNQSFEGDRGNILFETHDIEKKKQFSIGAMLRDLPGLSSQGLGNATRPIIRGMTNSRVKILQNGGSLSDVSEFGEDHMESRIIHIHYDSEIHRGEFNIDNIEQLEKIVKDKAVDY